MATLQETMNAETLLNIIRHARNVHNQHGTCRDRMLYASEVSRQCVRAGLADSAGLYANTAASFYYLIGGAR